MKWQRAARLVERVVGALYFLAAISICALFLLMFADISGRTLLGSPITGTAEMSEYLLVAIAFLSLGYAQKKGDHIAVDFLVSHFPENLKIFLEVLFSALSLCFFFIMAVQIGERTYHDWARKILLSQTTLPLPLWWMSFVAALGCAGLVVTLIFQLVQKTHLLLTGRYKPSNQGV